MKRVSAALGVILFFSALFWWRAEKREMFSRDGYVYVQAVEVGANHGLNASYEMLGRQNSVNSSLPPGLIIGASAVMRLCSCSAQNAILIYNYIWGLLFLAGLAMGVWALYHDEKLLWLSLCCGASLPSLVKTSSDLLREGSYLSGVMLATGALLWVSSMKLPFAKRLVLLGVTALAMTVAVFTRREGIEIVAAMLLWGGFELIHGLFRLHRQPFNWQRILADGGSFFLFLLVFCGGMTLLLTHCPACHWQILPWHKVAYLIQQLN